jgi:hypothetical protein
MDETHGVKTHGVNTHVFQPHDRQAWARIQQLGALLGDTTEVLAFPDAADEQWGIPTGVLLRAAAADALLFPAMLRDPGCGFLVFRLEADGFQTAQSDLCRALAAGAETFQDPEAGLDCLSRLALPVDEAEKGSIVDGFGSIINTLEIRSAYASASPQFPDGSLIGFIHGGCEGLVAVLEQRFGLPAAAYTLEHGLFPDEAVEQGFFAFPYASPEGQAYVQWLQAGMQLSRQSRLCAFRALSALMRAFDPNFQLHFLWDTVHSGIEIQAGEVITYRGAQRTGQMALVAGHRETSACIVLPGTAAALGGADAKGSADALGGGAREDRGAIISQFISHGTPFIEVAETTTAASEAACPLDLPALRRAARASGNTPKNYHTVAPLEDALRRYIQQASADGIVTPAAWLAPAINIQGKKRKASAMQAPPPPVIGTTALGDYRIEQHAPFRIRGGCRGSCRSGCPTAVIVLDRNLPDVTDALCNQLIERSLLSEPVTPFDLFVLESGSDRDRLSRYTSHHFVDEAAVKIGLRIARGLNAGVQLLPGYDVYGFFTNDVVLTHAGDTIGAVQQMFDRYPHIGLVECLGASAGFALWDPRTRAGQPVDLSTTPLFYTPYPIIRALFLRGDLLRKLAPDILCPDNWRNWGNDEDLGYRTWKAGYYVAASAALSIHEDTFLSTKKHAQVRTEDELTFKREAKAQMDAFILSRYQTDILTFRRRVFDTMLACVDDRLPVICPANLIAQCTT